MFPTPWDRNFRQQCLLISSCWQLWTQPNSPRPLQAESVRHKKPIWDAACSGNPSHWNHCSFTSSPWTPPSLSDDFNQVEANHKDVQNIPIHLLHIAKLCKSIGFTMSHHVSSSATWPPRLVAHEVHEAIGCPAQGQVEEKGQKEDDLRYLSRSQWSVRWWLVKTGFSTSRLA